MKFSSVFVQKLVTFECKDQGLYFLTAATIQQVRAVTCWHVISEPLMQLSSVDMVQ